MSTFEPIAPNEPDEFDPDAYEAMIAAMEDMTGGPATDVATTLQEAYNANQPRFPKGSPKAGQWRPKLVTGAGRIAPGHLTRDLKALSDLVDQANVYGPGGVGGHHLDAIGEQLEATALRYSARKHYEKRLDAIRVERNAIQDAGWEKYEEAWRAEPDPDKAAKIEMRDFLEPGDSQKLIDLIDEEARTRNQRDFADRDAMLGVLQKLRPMGGKLNQSPDGNEIDITSSAITADYNAIFSTDKRALAEMDADLDTNLKEVLKLIPTAWLDDTNGKGTTRFLYSKNRAWASTQTVDEKPQVDSFAAMEDATDQALAGKLPKAQAAQAAIDVMNATGDPLPELSPDERLTLRDSPETAAWRERRDQFAATLANQHYTWIGRAKTENYPDGLWAILRGQDDRRRYYLDWGGSLHLLDTMHARSGTGEVITGKRDDRRLNLPPKLTNKQSDAVDRALAVGDSWAGLYAGKYPVLLRNASYEGGVGPNAAIYDWVNEDGETKNLRHTTTTPPGGFDESKWDRDAPRPPKYAAAQNTQIKVDPRNKSTLLHELNHRLEVVYGDQNQAGYHPISMHTHRFLAERTAGESLQKLQDLYPGYAYEEHELARPDKFVDGYVGKNYPGEPTEVLTMGMEMLWYPQYGTRDINKDPGMRRFILGLLATL